MIPSNSIGNAPLMGVDLFMIDSGFQRVGFFKSKHIAYLVGSSIFDEDSSQVSLSNEVWGNESSELVFLNIRSGIVSGRLRLFYEELK